MSKSDYSKNPVFHEWRIADRKQVIEELKEEIRISTEFLFKNNKEKMQENISEGEVKWIMTVIFLEKQQIKN